MKFSIWSNLLLLFVCINAALVVIINGETIACVNRRSKCFFKPQPCPSQCPTTSPTNPKSKVCYMNCNSPICRPVCRNRKPNCNGRGAACLDPRFIGGDGVVFYFHGKKNEHFTLVSDHNLHINARFIGLRPAGRRRDYTWIQALGLLFKSNALSVETTKATTWDEQIEHLKFTYNGKEIILPEGYPSVWISPENDLKIERTSSKNGAMVTLPELAEVSVMAVPVTKEDDRIHNYKLPADDCFVHLEVQFRFDGLSPEVEGVLGRTYQPEFENPAKPGVAMPVVGGEDKYRTTSLLTADCGSCIFPPLMAME